MKKIFVKTEKLSNKELEENSQSILELVNVVNQYSASLSDSIKSLSKTNGDLSQAVNEQAASVEQTSSSVEEISAMVQNNVSETENSQVISKTVNEQMDDLKLAMQEIEESNVHIEELSGVIGEIASKTKIIDDIVFQTKLLSFNASVEAERAGEHGRGFAVVAQEVGNLAQMSGKAALEISEIVKASTEKSTKIVVDNRKRVEKGSNILDLVTEQTLANSKSTDHVFTASTEQAKGVDQIHSSVKVLNEAIHRIADISKTNSSAGVRLQAESQSLRDAANKLASIFTTSSMITEKVVPSKQVEEPISNITELESHRVQHEKVRTAAPQLKVVESSQVEELNDVVWTDL